MPAQFISHPDFSELEPIYIYHKYIDRKTFSHPEELKNRHIIYRKKATFGAFQKAVLKISADDYYKLYINGKYVAEGPASSYHNHYFYNELDVAEYLVEGENTFAVLTYYMGMIGNANVSGDLRQMLWFELSLDGKEALVSDESWKCAEHTGYTAMGVYGYDTGFLECYDAGAPETHFYRPDFDDSSFGYAKLTQKPEWVLFKQPTEVLDVYYMEPSVVKEMPYGLYVEMPTEAVGYLSFNAKGNRGDEVMIYCGEELNDDGSVRFDIRANCRYEEKMILSGGEDTMVNYDYKAFRFAEIHFPETVTVTDVKMQVRHYPFTQTYFYDTKDPTMKAVLDLCVNTIKYGTQEYFPDCPTREKGSYLGDLQVCGRVHVALTGDTTKVKHAVESFTMTDFICPGLITLSACSTMQEIADYALELPSLIAWLWSVDHDTAFVRKQFPVLMGMYDYFRKYENEDGLLEDVTEKWNMIDWPANLRDNYEFDNNQPLNEGLALQPGLGVHNVLNGLWYGCKLAMEEICSILGETADFETQKTLEGFRKAFYCEETGLFTDTPKTKHSAIHSNIFPLLLGMTDGDPALQQRIVDLIKEKRLKSMGVYVAYYTMAALKNLGEYDLCRELTCDPDVWPNMLKEGATTAFEAWGKDQKWNTSLFHIWATAPAVIFADHVRPY